MHLPTSIGANLHFSPTILPFRVLKNFPLMEFLQPKPLYQILESSSHFWTPVTSIDGLLSIPPYQNLHTIPNPPSPHLIHGQNGVVEQLQAVSNARGRYEQIIWDRINALPIIEKQTWYKGPWTKWEDRKLRRLVSYFGCFSWSRVASFMSRRIGKQCRERWHNNLRPPLEKSIVWSDEEEMVIIEGHERFGNRWSRIARFLPGRSENDVKNHWNKTLRRQYSTKNIQRSKRLRLFYKSTVLENYIRKKLFSSSAADIPPPITTIVESNPLFEVVSAPTDFTQPPIPTVSEKNALTETSSTTPAATANAPPIATDEIFSTATTCTQPPIPNVTEDTPAAGVATDAPSPISTIGDSNPLFEIFSTATATASPFTQPPIRTVSENNDLTGTFSTTPAATFTPPPPPFTTNTGSDSLYAIFSTATTATAFLQSPIPRAIENNALISTFFTPPPIPTVTQNYNALTATFAPPQFTANTESNALTATDLSLSVDDYDIEDGIPCFTFEFENGIGKNGDFMQQNMIPDVTGNAEGVIGIHPSPIIGDADCAASASYFAAEMVGEEMEFMKCLFGNNGGI